MRNGYLLVQTSRRPGKKGASLLLFFVPHHLTWRVFNWWWVVSTLLQVLPSGCPYYVSSGDVLYANHQTSSCSSLSQLGLNQNTIFFLQLVQVTMQFPFFFTQKIYIYRDSPRAVTPHHHGNRQGERQSLSELERTGVYHFPQARNNSSYIYSDGISILKKKEKSQKRVNHKCLSFSYSKTKKLFDFFFFFSSMVFYRENRK